jgi:putative heme transporter
MVEEPQPAAVFAPPGWLRDLGRTAWLALGVLALIAAITWLLGLAQAIVTPVLVGLLVATVTSPLVAVLQRHRVPRTAGALLILAAFVVLAVVIGLMVIDTLVAQRDKIDQYADEAAARLQSWMESAGVDENGAATAREHVQGSVPDLLGTLLSGVITGIRGITSLVLGASFTAFALFFLLRDGPALRSFVDRHLRVPPSVGRTITGDVVTSVRRYFIGVTVVALFNAVVVGLGAWILGVPLPLTIAVVTLVTAYVPFIGAFTAGTFAVVLALADGGTQTALIMLVIVILANGGLQSVVQSIAFGATLDLNPLLVLVLTISGGALFGMAGLVLTAPLVSAAVHVHRDLTRRSPDEDDGAAGAPG